MKDFKLNINNQFKQINISIDNILNSINTTNGSYKFKTNLDNELINKKLINKKNEYFKQMNNCIDNINNIINNNNNNYTNTNINSSLIDISNTNSNDKFNNINKKDISKFDFQIIYECNYAFISNNKNITNAKTLAYPYYISKEVNLNITNSSNSFLNIKRSGYILLNKLNLKLEYPYSFSYVKIIDNENKCSKTTNKIKNIYSKKFTITSLLVFSIISNKVNTNNQLNLNNKKLNKNINKLVCNIEEKQAVSLSIIKNKCDLIEYCNITERNLTIHDKINLNYNNNNIKTNKSKTNSNNNNITTNNNKTVLKFNNSTISSNKTIFDKRNTTINIINNLNINNKFNFDTKYTKNLSSKNNKIISTYKLKENNEILNNRNKYALNKCCNKNNKLLYLNKLRKLSNTVNYNNINNISYSDLNEDNKTNNINTPLKKIYNQNYIKSARLKYSNIDNNKFVSYNVSFNNESSFNNNAKNSQCINLISPFSKNNSFINSICMSSRKIKGRLSISKYKKNNKIRKTINLFNYSRKDLHIFESNVINSY